VIYLDDFQGIF